MRQFNQFYSLDHILYRVLFVFLNIMCVLHTRTLCSDIIKILPYVSTS